MLKPIDIENKEFKKVKFGGYDITEVEEFLEVLIVDYENLFKENQDIKEKLEIALETQKYYSAIDEGVNKTIENSKIVANEMKAEAKAEADSIKEKAKTASLLALEEIKLDIKAKEVEFENIKQQMKIYKIKVKSMLEAQMNIIDEE